MKIFNSIGHFFAWAISKGVPAVEKAALSPLATAIAQLLGAKGIQIQAGVEAIAGDVLSAFEDAGAVIGADGLNVKFDAATVAAIQAIYAELKAVVHG